MAGKTATEKHITLHTQPQIEQHELIQNTCVCVCVNVKVKVTHDKPARHRWETNVLFQPICNLSAMRGWVVSNMLQSRYPPEIIGTHGTGDGPMYLFVDVQNDFTMQKKTGRTETNVSLTQDATNNHKCITCSGFHKQPQILHIT